MIHKIAQLKQMIEDYKKRTKQPGKIIDIQVDGGIDLDTAPRVVGAGATVLSIGTAIFRSDDPGGFIKKESLLNFKLYFVFRFDMLLP